MGPRQKTVDKERTKAVWEEGMPPDPTMREISHRRSLYQNVNTFSTCAITNATKAAMKGLQADKHIPFQLFSSSFCIPSPRPLFISSIILASSVILSNCPTRYASQMEA
jgi:hypothetical protein